MPKLVLQFHGTTLEEIPMMKSLIMIGREPTNDIVIDNLAVSRQHVKIFQDEQGYWVEDLQSGNGTFVNEKAISREALKDQDAIVVGKHTLLFVDDDQLLIEEAEERAASSLAEQTYILPKNQLAALRAGTTPGTEEQGAEMEGGIVVLSGGARQKRIALTKRITVGGKSPTADIRLRGLFVGKSAFLISNRPEGFCITPTEGRRRTKVNGEVVPGQRALQDGDCITIGATHMRFYCKKSSGGKH
jgi:pSer/pThr/pTyr-binding forkhead associated (FHA) protein